MENSEIRYLGDLQRLEIRPGDKFVIRVNRPITLEHAEALREQWHRFAGNDIPVLILVGDTEIGAIGMGEAA